MAGSLDSVRSKIRWAEKHRQAINAEVSGYFEKNAGLVVAELHPQLYGGGVSNVYGPPHPDSIALLIGDCLQNLRSALDYLVWELCLSAKREPGKHNAFPVCKSPESFKKRVKEDRLLDGVPEEAAAEIERLQPYQSGDLREYTRLWVLNELTNINKHRRILFTALNADTPSAAMVSSGYTGFGTELSRNMDMNEGLVAYIQFNEGVIAGQEVSGALRGLIDFVQTSVTPQFERFFS